MSITTIARNVVEGQAETYIEVDTSSVNEYYTVQYGLSGCTFPKNNREGAIEDYLSNIRHQLKCADLA